MLPIIRQFVMDEEGASAAEYALLVALITVAMAAAVTTLGTNITNAITSAASKITTGGGGS